MKIALCLSGQPRFVEEVSPYILSNVCDGYHVDVFCHFWFDDKLQNEPYKFGECGKGEWHNQRISSNSVEKALEIYNPISYKIETSKSFSDSSVPFEQSLRKYWYGALDDPDQKGFRNRTVNNCLSYFYSLNEVNKLKKEYEYAHDFKYDWVVRCRTDTIIHTKIPFEHLDPSVINFSNLQNQPDGMINDWFDFAGSKEMDVFMSVFPVWQVILEKCMKETGAWCHELMHRKMVDSFGIGIHGHPIRITLPRF
jgi:hypothetical protein